MKVPIPYEEIARLPLPGTAVLMQLGFGPEDKVLTYLQCPELGLNRRLYVNPQSDSGDCTSADLQEIRTLTGSPGTGDALWGCGPEIPSDDPIRRCGL